MEIKNKINLLDCTMRDGGYYNNWDFSLELAQDYIKALTNCGVRNIELGFRNMKIGQIKGPNWYTTDDYIENLKIPKFLNIGVMCNVFDLVSPSINLEKTIDQLFRPPKKTRINFVRIASHFDELAKASIIIKILKRKGFFVMLNLMQITEQLKDKIIFAGKIANECQPNVLYFADSLGRMDEKKISEVINQLKLYWKGKIGIHAHDNLSKALSNSLFAIKNGVSWVDSTISGMGRGPGNVKTEELILEKEILKDNKLTLLPLIELIRKHFYSMKNFYQWGTNPYYYLAGKYGIHPTYIQEMISQKISDAEIIKMINLLKENNKNKYEINLVISEFQKPIKITKGKWSPVKKLKNQEVLLIGSGEKTTKYKEVIENYIKIKKPIVIALKINTAINPSLINYYISCNPLRIVNEIKKLKNLKKLIIIPKTLIKGKIKFSHSQKKILDFGIGIKDNKFKFFKNCAYLDKLYTISYALAVATSGKASKISLAGFDGYGEKDIRTKNITQVFTNYINHKNSLPLKFITPSAYNFNIFYNAI